MKLIDYGIKMSGLVEHVKYQAGNLMPDCLTGFLRSKVTEYNI